MKYGWMWKIPVKDRIGAGYVFDSDYLTDGEAIDEVQQVLGQTLLNARSIPFEAGRNEQVWVKNCIGIGLAASFVEPVEATALDSVALQLKELKGYLNHVFTYNEKSVSAYNDFVANMMDGLIHFVYLHYLTKRNDSEFWRNFRERHPVPQKFEKVLQLIHENNLREVDVETSPFMLVDFLEICNGLEIFKQPIDMEGYENLTPSVAEYKKINDEAILNSTTRVGTPMLKHTDFLAGLYGPERLGSPLGPQCHCQPGFHRTG
jgi:tryptophan halogenase